MSEGEGHAARRQVMAVSTTPMRSMPGLGGDASIDLAAQAAARKGDVTRALIAAR